MTARVAVSEAAFQSQVIRLAHLLGWGHMHCRRSVGKGRAWTTATNIAWPDLTLWCERQQRFMVIELKSESGRLSSDQAATLASLEAAGVECHVFRPSDWDELVATLNRPAAAA